MTTDSVKNNCRTVCEKNKQKTINKKVKNVF